MKRSEIMDPKKPPGDDDFDFYIDDIPATPGRPVKTDEQLNNEFWLSFDSETYCPDDNPDEW